jgi:hypothetical protein
LDGAAARLARQAQTTAGHRDARTNPVTVANRINTDQAEVRRLSRELQGQMTYESSRDEDDTERRQPVLRPPSQERVVFLRREIAELTVKIEYWQSVYTQLQAEGRASTLGSDTVATGDWVLVWNRWALVLRVNQKSVSVPNANFPAPARGEREETMTVPWHKLGGHRRPQDMNTDYTQAYQIPGCDRMWLHPTTSPVEGDQS